MLKLWSVIQQHIDWQHNACHTLDLTVQDAYNLMEIVRSHPYNPQAERENLLVEVKLCYEAKAREDRAEKENVVKVLRPHVLYFALRMEEKLRKHDKERGSRGWVGYSQPEEQQYLFNRLTEEVKELKVEIKRRESVVEKFGEPLVNSPSESIDVGNFAMMIYTALYSDETCGGMINYMVKTLSKGNGEQG
jgi:hypothetical protein